MPERPATWDDLLRHEAAKARVPFALAKAVMEAESGGRPDVVSPKGAIGLMQLMPDTAKGLGVDPADPIQNLRGGVTYLRQMLDLHKGDVRKALTAYNAGPNAQGADQFPETQAYVERVLGRLSGQPAQAPQQTATPSATPHRVTAGALPAEALGVAPPSLDQPRPQPAAPPNPQDFEPGGQPQFRGIRFAAEQPESAVGTPPGMLASMAEGFDPRTSPGRRNLAGATGALLAGAATRNVSGVRAGFAAGSAAAVAGGLAEAGEQLVGNQPPSVSRVAGAAAEQGLYEWGGQAVMWPVKALGRRVVASRVGRQASEALTGARAAIEEKLDQALTSASRVLRSTRTNAATALSNARTGAAEGLRSARGTARTGVQTADAAGVAQVAPLEQGYAELVGQPPSAAAAGRSVSAVLHGPARSARDRVGEQVEAAAKSGPEVDLTPLKAEAQRILTKEIKTPQTAFPRAPIGSVADEALGAAGVNPDQLAKLAEAGDPKAAAALAQLQEAIGAAQAEAEGEILKHPALGVLNRILNAGDRVPFEAAHQFKRELDDAIGAGAWDDAIKKRVTAITQHLRGTLRGSLTGHKPYDEATAAYQAIVPLYTKGVIPKFRKQAIDSPESIVRLIKGNEPTRAQMLRDLLLDQAEAGGDAALGQQAWDSVRAAWTHDKLLRGGIDTISDRIAKLDPEFVDILYGDASGKGVLTSLQAIETAYKQTADRVAQQVAAAKGAGRTGVDMATRAGQRGIESARLAGTQAVGEAIETEVQTKAVRSAAKKPTEIETAFADSSIGRLRGIEAQLADAMRAGALGVGSIWGAISLLRLMNGPKGADLVQWAAFSPKGTQLLVQALTSPAPGMALAEVMRTSGMFDDRVIDRATKDAEGPVGAPPPAITAPTMRPVLGSARVGQPPQP